MPQRLALLVGANPRVTINGPIVRLYDGLWTISSQGLEDSSLILERKSKEELISATILKDERIEIKGDCSIQVFFGKKGTEQSISAFAELKVNEPDSTTV
jgi:hypothetical protein